MLDGLDRMRFVEGLMVEMLMVEMAWVNAVILNASTSQPLNILLKFHDTNVQAPSAAANPPFAISQVSGLQKPFGEMIKI